MGVLSFDPFDPVGGAAGEVAAGEVAAGEVVAAAAAGGGGTGGLSLLSLLTLLSLLSLPSLPSLRAPHCLSLKPPDVYAVACANGQHARHTLPVDELQVQHRGGMPHKRLKGRRGRP